MLAAVRPSAVVAKTTARKTTARRSSVVAMSGRRVDVARVEKSDADWKKELNAQEFQVLRKKGTEPARTGEYDKFYPSEGHFVCRGCGTPLYSAKAKFDSGCGWPSFTKPVETQNVKELRDSSVGMVRVEVRSLHGDSHLGHVFPDGPQARGGLRYCINSAALRFIHRDDLEAEGYGAYRDQVEDVV